MEVLPLMSSPLCENAITVDQMYANYDLYLNLKGSRDGAVVRVLASHQCDQGSIPGPGVICGLSLLFGSRPCSEGFFPGSPVFLLSQKSTLLNFNSIWKQWMKSYFVEMPLQIPIYLLFYLHG